MGGALCVTTLRSYMTQGGRVTPPPGRVTPWGHMTTPRGHTTPQGHTTTRGGHTTSEVIRRLPRSRGVSSVGGFKALRGWILLRVLHWWIMYHASILCICILAQVNPAWGG